MKKYNVLTVTPFFTPDIGGIANHVFNLDVNLDKMSHVNSYFKKNIIDFNNKFSRHTSNYTLLVILHVPNKKDNYHEFTYDDNIHFLELHTISSSNGLKFNNDKDNDYLNNVIKNRYN